ncbi:putative formin-like protein 6 isoform X2 [Iris pallida]|uniref:Formin-like protein 6 isoform X2 n=1 Tax=Iris pallida TaxID=29817 RepID=A0AAX6GE92_IRIPA|nr:putative formin-like protein 6 isoform X2 [Iris pallida]
MSRVARRREPAMVKAVDHQGRNWKQRWSSCSAEPRRDPRRRMVGCERSGRRSGAWRGRSGLDDTR